MKPNPVIILSGPTASHKTQTAIALVQNLKIEAGIPVEVVNFDSLLFYRELNIGTAKPTPAEMQSVPHHLIDIASAKSPLNAADYAAKATTLISELHASGKIPILAGGSGFYLRALIKGMYEEAHVPTAIREKSDELYNKEGIAPFLHILERQDPETFAFLHQNDHYRLRRAVEFFWSSGEIISKARARMALLSPYDFSKGINAHWQILHCHLDMPKPEHIAVIRARTEQMLKNGLVDEVKGLLSTGFTGEEKPLNSIGYKEVIDYLAGKHSTLDECREKIVISTRQLAKAQRTWFKKVGPKHVFHPIEAAAEFYATVKTFLELPSQT